MQNSELKKNLSNDTIFNAINKMFISLEDNDIHKTNEALLPMIQTIINLMKSKDSLFKEAYQEIIFLGSFYKGTKIEKPNEFDLNIILKLPLNNKEINFYSERPAFVKIKIDESSINDSSKYKLLPDKGKKSYKNIIKDGYLNPNKFRQWIQGILFKALNDFPKVKNEYELTVDQLKAKIKIKQSGPACTLIINIPHIIENICIDLVPALAFHIKYINKFISKFDKLENCKNEIWFAIPSPLTDNDSNNNNFYWRLSFSYQEKEILSRYGRIKPVIRQMKMLQELYYACNKHTLECYWDKKYNLFSKISKIEMQNISCRLKNIINTIEKYSSDQFILASFILNSKELELLKERINNHQYIKDKNDEIQQKNSNSCVII
ncbi:cyclic GMP-AMP synthase-like receptor isoform X2 [Apis cerana]|uniref:cyclic GMP-AMP synthase-like receptor isoform X2 n=1 Tax=Apis cerana TaxID=7461 RepID=UPI002B23008D|nr:cyclic GMP-AMP synthase-like receptor isoform X2 [Apis cerana]